MGDSLRDQLLLAEFGEAWSHYRHIEVMRQQYVGLFFSLLIGVSGLTATLAPKVDLSLPASLLGAAGLMWALSVFSMLLFANIRKMGRVLGAYEATMKFVREEVYGDDYDRLFTGLSVRAMGDPVMTLPIYRLQSVSEWILGASALGFSAGLVALTIYVWNSIELGLRLGLAAGVASSFGLISYA